MKLLVLSNFYPPYKIGGYEMLCQEVVEALCTRGHSAIVVTSTYGVESEVSEGYVHRLLTLESNLQYYQIKHAWTYPFNNKQNIYHLHHFVSTFEPDIIFIWGMWSLSKQLAAESENLLKSRVVYYLANPWPIEANLHTAFWDNPARKSYRRLFKRLLLIPARLWLHAEWEPVALQFQYAPCCSEALRNQLVSAGVPLKDAPIIYEGIDLAKYSAFGNHRNIPSKGGKLSLLYVGILAPHKGVHTAIEAITHLKSSDRQKVDLTILGTGHPQYESLLHNMVDTHNLHQCIKFQSPIPRSELPEYLSGFHVLLLPSTWDEPLALIMQEGLASGMVVIGSATGGTKEIITDGQNGFLFSAEDSSGLARKIEQLLADPILFHLIAEKGQQTAFEKFDLTRMVNELEQYLINLTGRNNHLMSSSQT